MPGMPSDPLFSGKYRLTIVVEFSTQAYTRTRGEAIRAMRQEAKDHAERVRRGEDGKVLRKLRWATVNGTLDPTTVHEPECERRRREAQAEYRRAHGLEVSG